MNRQNRKDRFFMQVGEAMFMNDMRSFINMDTLEVEIHVSEDYFFYNEMEDSAKEETTNPDKYFPVEQEHSSTAFRVMESFAETVADNRLKGRLTDALERKKPFANFKIIIDNSAVREQWFAYRDEAYANIAMEWIELNAPEPLKKKIQELGDET